MVLNRSTDARKGKHAAPLTTQTQGSNGYQLRSQSSVTTTAPSTTVRPHKAKEKWETAKPAREFAAALGKETFQRVTGTYKPATESPAWDPVMEDRSVPFYRSTPADEVLEMADEGLEGIAGAAALAVSRPVSFDISAGNAPLRVVSTEVTQPTISHESTVTLPGRNQPHENVLNMSLESLHDSVRRLSTASPSTAASGTTNSMNAHVSTARFNASTNPFDVAAPVVTVPSVTSVIDYGAVGRGRVRAGLERNSLSPVPSAAGVAFRGAEQVRPRSEEGRQGTDMAAVRLTVAKGDHIVNVFQTEYADLIVEEYTPAMLSELCAEANTHKKALARVLWPCSSPQWKEGSREGR